MPYREARCYFINPGKYFNKALMVFKEFNDIEEIGYFTFNICSFWVHLLDVPIGLSNKRIARILGAKAGVVSEVEQKKSRVGYGIGIKVSCFC